MTLSGLFQLLDFAEDWEYVIHISGDSLPLRSNKDILNELKIQNQASSFMYQHQQDVEHCK